MRCGGYAVLGHVLLSYKLTLLNSFIWAFVGIAHDDSLYLPLDPFLSNTLNSSIHVFGCHMHFLEKSDPLLSLGG